VTVNAGSKTDTIGRLHEAVPGLAPDVLCVEECSGEEFRRLWPPENVFVERGLCLASRYPFHDPTLLYDQALGGNGVVARFDVDAPRGRFRLVIVHLETPRDGLDEFRHRGWKAAPTLEAQSAVRQREAEAVRAWMGRAGPTIVAGDFNTPDESRIFASAWDGLENAFSVAGWGFGYTKRTRLIRVRIDHVLATEHFDVAASFVGPDIGSDHLPVIADLRWR
jgi:endonuclease/exonuclease/phosphatase family metal-dependent hydrolase